jgi:hypothetical protein
MSDPKQTALAHAAYEMKRAFATAMSQPAIPAWDSLDAATQDAAVADIARVFTPLGGTPADFQGLEKKANPELPAFAQLPVVEQEKLVAWHHAVRVMSAAIDRAKSAPSKS